MTTEAGPSSPSAQAAAETLTDGEGDGPPTVDLLESYRDLVASGRLKWDDEQVRVVMKVGVGGGAGLQSSCANVSCDT